MDAIVAADRNWAIGNKGQLLTHLPGDLRYFREMTMGRVIVVGRKTLESFPGGKPLPGRTHLLLSAGMKEAPEGCILCRTPDEVREKAAAYGEGEVFVCGGESVYRIFLEDCRAVWVTRMEAEFAADRWFEDLDLRADFALAWESEPHTENGITYRFTRYERIEEKERETK